MQRTLSLVSVDCGAWCCAEQHTHVGTMCMHVIKYIFSCLHKEVHIDTSQKSNTSICICLQGPRKLHILHYYTITAIKSSTLYVQLLLCANATDTHIIRLSGICVFIKSIKWCV